MRKLAFRDSDQVLHKHNTARGLKFGILKVDSTIRAAKTKALISFGVTAKLICIFVFAYAKSRFSHKEAQIIVCTCDNFF